MYFDFVNFIYLEICLVGERPKQCRRDRRIEELKIERILASRYNFKKKIKEVYCFPLRSLSPAPPLLLFYLFISEQYFYITVVRIDEERETSSEIKR